MRVGRGKRGAAQRLALVRALVLLACVFCTGCKIGEVLKGLFFAVAGALLMGSLFGTLGKGGALATAKGAAAQAAGAQLTQGLQSGGGGGDGEASRELAGTDPAGTRRSEETIGGKTKAEILAEAREAHALEAANNPYEVKGQLPDRPLPKPKHTRTQTETANGGDKP